MIDTTSVCFCEVATMSATDSCHAGAYPGFCLKSEDKKFLHYKKSPIPLEHIIIISILQRSPFHAILAVIVGRGDFAYIRDRVLHPRHPAARRAPLPPTIRNGTMSD